MKIVTASANRELDEILDLIGFSVQLTLTQYEKAEISYHAVADWLGAPNSEVLQYHPEIFAQGSLRLDTTVKPLSHTEFDLDLVCLVQISDLVKPAAVYDLLLNRMRAHDTYNKIIIEMPRCIRLNYSGDFHLDIVPAVPVRNSRFGDSCIRIPDRPKQQWRDTNPKGYAIWLDKQAAKRILVEKVARFSSNASVEKLRDPVPAFEKPPLKLSIQLLKRWRDLAFKGRENLAPSSIVLTTLSGILYKGEDHPTDVLLTILDGIYHWSQQVEQIELFNPSNGIECITDRWKDEPDAYQAFIEAVYSFRASMHNLIENSRYPDMISDLKELFGDWPVNGAISKFAERRKAASENGNLLIERSTGILKVSAAPALTPDYITGKGHTFHGEEV